MSTTEVLVLLEGDELPQCPECCAPMFASHSRYYANDDSYYLKAEVECERGHIRTYVQSPQPLDDEMRELLN
jgi:hypothetical protein